MMGINYENRDDTVIEELKTLYLRRWLTDEDILHSFLSLLSNVLVAWALKNLVMNEGETGKYVHFQFDTVFSYVIFFYLCNVTGGNGKSAASEFIADVLGSYSEKISSSCFTDKNPDNASLSKIDMKRFVYAEEPDINSTLQASRIKDLTGKFNCI